MDNRLISMAAKAYLDAGLSLIPINRKTKRPASWLLPQATTSLGEPLFWKKVKRADGTEAAVTTTENTGSPKGTWEPYQQRQPTAAEVATWVAAGIESIAVVGGEVSGGLEILDFDNRQGETWYAAWAELTGNPVERYKLPLQQTGGLGFQVAWRSSVVEGNQKLAWARAPEEASGRKAMIETRGSHGYALWAPSLHPSNRPYQILHGRLSQVPAIEAELRNYFLNCARQLSQVTEPERVAKSPVSATFSAEGAHAVVAAYNRNHSIENTLQRYGYTQCGNRWSRPGKADSLGVIVYDDGKAYAFSSNDVMAADRCGVGDNRPFTAFDLYAHYDHNQDYKAATRAAAQALGLSTELHTLIYVEGYDNAAAVREVMFPHGWVARGFRPDKINLDGIGNYRNVIVWAYNDWTARTIVAKLPGAHAVVVPNGLDAQAMVREGILQPYLDAVLADAKHREEIDTWIL